MRVVMKRCKRCDKNSQNWIESSFGLYREQKAAHKWMNAKKKIVNRTEQNRWSKIDAQPLTNSVDCLAYG